MSTNNLYKTSLTTAIVLLMFAAPAQAQEDSRGGNQDATPLEALVSGLSFHINAGAYYNSNVSVSELDVNVGTGDVSAKLSAQVKFEQELGENTEFDIRYKLSTTTHEEFSKFDVLTHLVSTKLEHDFGNFKAGVSYQFANSSLNQNNFLTLNQISPYASRFIGKKAYVRGFYGYADKAFKSNPTRDANVHKGGADIYFFLDGVRQYVQTGYSYEDSDANADEFDYGAHKFKLRYIKRLDILGRKTKFKAGWRYQKRDYDNITPSIGVVRDDNRHRFQLELEVPITDVFYAQIELERAVHSSNLPSADYNRSIVAFSLGAKF